MDEVLELLDKTAKRVQKTAEETKGSKQKTHRAFTSSFCSRRMQRRSRRLKAFVKKTIELDGLERLNSQLSLLYTLQIFAFKVKVLEVSVDTIKDQLVKSGVLQSGMELEDIKKNIDTLKILIEAQYESMKEINDTQNRTSATYTKQFFIF